MILFNPDQQDSGEKDGEVLLLTTEEHV